MTDASCVVDCGNSLGEGPVWDQTEQALYWVDIQMGLLQRFEPLSGEIRRWSMPERVGALALRQQGGLVVAQRLTQRDDTENRDPFPVHVPLIDP